MNHKAASHTPSPISLPSISMVFGLLSLTGILSVLGIPALITGIISLKKYPTSKPASITGIVSGAIGICIFVTLCALVLYLLVTTLSSDTVYPGDSRSYPCGSHASFCAEPVPLSV